MLFLQYLFFYLFTCNLLKTSTNRKNLLKWLILVVVFVVSFTLSSNIYIKQSTKSAIYNSTKNIPNNNVGLILGTSRYTYRGTTNLFFKYRIQAAVELYTTGKIKHIIVSGDNSVSSYNEPREMRKALISAGVNANSITLDYAGFRTLDSVVRCKKVFSQNKFTIISQQFHIERAIFIAKKYDIDAIGYAAKTPSEEYSTKTLIREYFAKTKAVLDLYVLHTKPKFLGKKETITL